MLNNLLDLTAEEILVQWNAANPLEQREILGRALVLLAGIANRINEG